MRCFSGRLTACTPCPSACDLCTLNEGRVLTACTRRRCTARFTKSSCAVQNPWRMNGAPARCLPPTRLPLASHPGPRLAAGPRHRRAGHPGILLHQECAGGDHAGKQSRTPQATCGPGQRPPGRSCSPAAYPYHRHASRFDPPCRACLCPLQHCILHTYCWRCTGARTESLTGCAWCMPWRAGRAGVPGGAAACGHQPRPRDTRGAGEQQRSGTARCGAAPGRLCWGAGGWQ